MVKSRASKYRGVYRCGTKWKAQIQIDGIQHYLGVFDDQESAAEAYKDFARKKGRFLMIENYSNDTMTTEENEPIATQPINHLQPIMKTDGSTSTLSFLEKELAPSITEDTVYNNSFAASNHQGMSIDFDHSEGLLLSNLTEESFSNLPFNTQTYEKGLQFGSYPTMESPESTPTETLPPLDETTKTLIKIRKLKILLGKCLCAASMNNLTHFQYLTQSSGPMEKDVQLSCFDQKLSEITERSFRLSESIQVLVNEILTLQQQHQQQQQEQEYEH